MTTQRSALGICQILFKSWSCPFLTGDSWTHFLPCKAAVMAPASHSSCENCDAQCFTTPPSSLSADYCAAFSEKMGADYRDCPTLAAPRPCTPPLGLDLSHWALGPALGSPIASLHPTVLPHLPMISFPPYRIFPPQERNMMLFLSLKKIIIKAPLRMHSAPWAYSLGWWRTLLGRLSRCLVSTPS